MSHPADRKAAPSPAPIASRHAAFTIVELLAAMAVIVLMTVAVVPAFNGIQGAGNVTKAAYDVSSLLDQAKSYAMANNTYVFVGIAERDGLDATKTGVGQIVVSVMGSKDGTRAFGANNANLAPISKLRRLSNVHLGDTLPNSGALSRPSVADSYRVGNSAFQAESTFTSSGISFSKIIQFDPAGTAAVQASSPLIPQWMEVGMVPARGNTVISEQNCAAVVLDGVTGATKIYRP